MAQENDVQLKALGPFEIKNEETGEVEAIIATLNVVDKDYDVILPGAIKDGAKVKLSSYGHNAMFGETPVGKGALHNEGEKVVFKGRFFLETQGGVEAFRTVKAMGAEQEWSFGFRVLGREVPDEKWREKGARQILTKLHAFEVSPVIIGAGVGTRTVAVKEAEDDPAVTAARELEAKAALEEQAASVAALQGVNSEARRIFDRGRRFLGKH